METLLRLSAAIAQALIWQGGPDGLAVMGMTAWPFAPCSPSGFEVTCANSEPLPPAIGGQVSGGFQSEGDANLMAGLSVPPQQEKLDS